MKRLMAVDEAKEVCRDRSVWRFVAFVLTTLLGIKCEAKLSLSILYISRYIF